MCNMRERESYDANGALRPSRGLQALLRQDDSDGRVATALTTEMCHMQSEDPSTETNSHPTGLLDVREIMGLATKRIGVQHGYGCERWGIRTWWQMGYR